MSKASETLSKAKKQRDSAVKAVRELVDMIDMNGAMACFWCARLLDSANCPADCTKENDRPAWEFGGSMLECSEGVSPWIEKPLMKTMIQQKEEKPA